MNGICRTFVCAVAGFASSLISNAQFYTIGPGGPSGYAPDTVFTPGGPPPTLSPGATSSFVGPPPPYPFAGPGAYVIDGLASGRDAGFSYRYSVAAGAVGLPASPVAFQVTVGSGPSHVFGPGAPVGPTPPEAAGDVFSIAGPVFGVLALSTPLAFAAPAFTDEFALGLNVGPVVPDNLNALTYRAAFAPGFYYSLAAGGLGASGAAPADILNITGLWAPALALGLDSLGAGSDDIDALLVQDLGILGAYEPGIDFVAFSLTPGSATLGLLGYAPGTGGGDLFFPGPLPGLFIPGTVFGLAPLDNLDAIDVVPEPAAGILLLLAGVGFACGRRWQSHCG